MLTKSEEVRIWKEEVVAYLQLGLCRYSLQETEENHETTFVKKAANPVAISTEYLQ
jgi:hypothetical protein